MGTPEDGEEQQRRFEITGSVRVVGEDGRQHDQQDKRAGSKRESGSRLPLAAVVIAALALAANAMGLWFTRDAFKKGNRAWILVSEIPLRPDDKPDDPGSFLGEWGGNVNVGFRNFGRGPARSVRVATRVVCVPQGGDCPDPGMIESPRGSDFVMGPDHSLSLDHTFAWIDGTFASGRTLANLNMLQVNCRQRDIVRAEPHKPSSHVLFALTKITYVDQFGDAHWTHHCAVWNAVQHIWDAAQNGNDFD